MNLLTLALYDFRNYQEASFSFSPCLNVIHGSNAQGKTSLLEAIYFLITGRSFRTSDNTDLIRHGASAFHLEATFLKHGIEQRLRVSFSGKEKRLYYNQNPLPTLGSLLGILHGVALTPDDIELVKGAPCNRRDFIDLQIGQVNPLYMHHLSRFARAMRQRNLLLRGKNLLTIESWEHEMALSAAFITEERMRATQEVSLECQKIHSKMVEEDENFSLSYRNNASLQHHQQTYQSYFLEQWNKMRRREMDLGATLIGPHKDDLDLMLYGKEARYFASEGQQRSCVAAMRFAEWERLRNLSNICPLMLIDDLGVSLDEFRRERLLKALNPLGQVFVTATSDVSRHFDIPEKKEFRIMSGQKG